MIGDKIKNNTEISARVKLLISDLGGNPNAFAKSLGYQRAQTIYDIINGKAAPSYDFFRRFADSEYSEKYDLHWLLTGRGGMVRKERSADPEGSAAVCGRDPRDVEALADKNKIIQRDEELLASLRRRIAELEEGKLAGK